MIDEPAELDPRVSMPDDGIPLMDDADSEVEQDRLPDDSFDADAADFETEH